MESTLNRYWGSFWCPSKILPKFEMHSPWWISGEDCAGRESVCFATVSSETLKVKEYVRNCFDPGTDLSGLVFRFVERRASDWSPFCDRFSKAVWMCWPPHPIKRINTSEYKDHEEVNLDPKNVNHVFHSLWTKAVGTPDYDKGEWKELARMITELGIPV